MVRKLRRLYWRYVRRHDGEICEDCGGPVWVAWWAPSPEWRRVVGTAWPLGRPWCDAIVLCIPCFDRRAQRQGIYVLYEAVCSGS